MALIGIVMGIYELVLLLGISNITYSHYKIIILVQY